MLGGHVTAADGTLPPQKGGGPDDECVICLEGEKNHIVMPCGHLVLCGTCALFIGTSLSSCPVCNVKASAPFTFRIFRT
ncbi:hypothetical protein T484DRAFT_1958715 [Baffinella frigidus]|nr:hypothetical protein T484DRAFT_1958715 [Cryptophyta sp. CCMP2293]